MVTFLTLFLLQDSNHLFDRDGARLQVSHFTQPRLQHTTAHNSSLTSDLIDQHTRTSTRTHTIAQSQRSHAAAVKMGVVSAVLLVVITILCTSPLPNLESQRRTWRGVRGTHG